MPSVCFYFQVHLPWRLRRYGVFEIGRRSDYFDDGANEAVLRKVADKCYLPMNALLREAIDRHEGRFRVAFSITGTALEQMQRWCPDALESFQALVATGCVELLAETHCHSLAFLCDRDEFDEQVDAHGARLLALFGVSPRVFRNTELIFRDDLAAHLAAGGFRAALVEGAERILGWRSPHFVYASAAAPELRLLPKSYRLSDDIAFRFGDRSWPGHPLRAEKFAGWIHGVNGLGDVVNLFMDYETFGEHQWAETGIFEFMRRLPAEILAHPDGGFLTPSEAVERFPARAPLEVPDFVSWADAERDLSAWTGNAMQRASLHGLFELREPVRATRDPALLRDWKRLSTSDHFYYNVHQALRRRRRAQVLQPFRLALRGAHRLPERALRPGAPRRPRRLAAAGRGLSQALCSRAAPPGALRSRAIGIEALRPPTRGSREGGDDAPHPAFAARPRSVRHRSLPLGRRRFGTAGAPRRAHPRGRALCRRGRRGRGAREGGRRRHRRGRRRRPPALPGTPRRDLPGGRGHRHVEGAHGGRLPPADARLRERGERRPRRLPRQRRGDAAPGRRTDPDRGRRGGRRRRERRGECRRTRSWRAWRPAPRRSPLGARRRSDIMWCRRIAAFLGLALAPLAAAGDPADPVREIDAAAVREAFAKGAPLLETAGYKVHASRRETAGQTEVHERDTDVIYVLEGSAAFVTGGSVVEPKTVAPGETRGSAIVGGTTRELLPGEVVVVPNGVPHWFESVRGPLLYYVVKVTSAEASR